MKNIVYISGVHGSGKSTLRKKLEKEDKFLLHNRPGHIKLEEIFARQLWRLARYDIELRDQIIWAKSNPDKYIIGDRCVYDNLMYNRCFLELGWLSKEDFDKLQKVFEILFDENDRPKNIVFLNPPIDEIRSWIEKRWEIEGQKWNEEKFEYLETLKKIYEKFYREELKNVNLLEINTTNREEQVKQLLKWAEKIK